MSVRNTTDHFALLSVSDKAGIVEFGRDLIELGFTLISTGGTARTLAGAGLAVTPVEKVTGFPEMMDGRVKTLHPKIHGGILGRRDLESHRAEMEAAGITPIDLVCVNLYPFEETVARDGVTREEAIEQIDIGGPSMVRSSAKNHADVLIVTEPSQYGEVVGALRAGNVPVELRRRLARAAFARTAAYDAAITDWLIQEDGA